MIKNKLQKYDLEERTYKFAKDCRDFTQTLQKSTINIEYIKQFIRSSSSVAANYIEANEAVSKKDFYFRIKICRKEAKESRLWLKLVLATSNQKVKIKNLIIEATELTKIFGAIVSKNTKANKSKSLHTAA